MNSDNTLLSTTPRQEGSSQNVRMSLERILGFGRRNRFTMMFVGLVVSMVVHVAVAQVAHISEIYIVQSEPVCRVGELLRVDAEAKIRWGARTSISAMAQWSSSDENIVQSLAGGSFRCMQEGTVTITTTYASKSSSVSVRVEPAVIMIEPPKPLEPEPPPPQPEVTPPPQQVPQPTEKPAVQPAPEAAKAGAILEASKDPNAQKSEEAVSFPTNPDGTEYASGVTANQGTSDQPGKPGAKVGGTPGGTGITVSTSPQPTIQPPISTVDLSKAPMLLGVTSGACRGYFPEDAEDDNAMVTLLVTVGVTGKVESVNVVAENPAGQNFGRAARNCITSKQFSPGLDRAGRPVTKTTRVNLSFVR